MPCMPRVIVARVISGISNKANSIVGDAILPFASIVSSILMLISILIALLFIDPVVAMSSFAGFAAIYFCHYGYS